MSYSAQEFPNEVGDCESGADVYSCNIDLEHILRLRPCRRPLLQSQASWLLAWRLGNILIGLLACWVLLSGFSFASTLCWSVCWLVRFWMLVSMALFFVFAAASLQPLSCALL